MENLKEKFELSDEALEQVSGGTDARSYKSYYYCPRCKKTMNTDSTKVTITSSGIAKHSCGETLILYDSSTTKISPQNN